MTGGDEDGRAERGAQEDTEGRWPSSHPGGRPREEPVLPLPGPRTPSLQDREEVGVCVLGCPAGGSCYDNQSRRILACACSLDQAPGEVGSWDPSSCSWGYAGGPGAQSRLGSCEDVLRTFPTRQAPPQLSGSKSSGRAWGLILLSPPWPPPLRLSILPQRLLTGGH